MASCDVVKDAAMVLEKIRDRVPWYAGDFAPLRTDQISVLLKRSSCDLQLFDFPIECSDVAFVLPMMWGVNTICVNKRATRTDRQFAIRHELAHVHANECAEPTYLSDRDYTSSSERVADLVALADLWPAWMIQHARDEGCTWNDLREEAEQGIAHAYAQDWPVERVRDRAQLRIQLFRECAI